MKGKKEVSNFEKMYFKYYRKLLLIPVLLFLFSVAIIIGTIQEEGTPIYRDISLKGGLSAIVEVDTQISQAEFSDRLHAEFSENTFSVSELFDEGLRSGFIVDTDLDEDSFFQFISGYFGIEFVHGENYMSNFISPTLSAAFFKQAMLILLISFFFMSVVIFAYFREFVPSMAIILSVIFDIVVTVAILNLLKFEVSIAGIGALLMIIGYSIDTDVLLTNRLIREFGDDYFEKLSSAFKTGMLMTGTTLIAGIGAMILTNSDVIFEIALILVVGLLVDAISTWVQNTAILMWWLNRNNG